MSCSIPFAWVEVYSGPRRSKPWSPNTSKERESTGNACGPCSCSNCGSEGTLDNGCNRFAAKGSGAFS